MTNGVRYLPVLTNEMFRQTLSNNSNNLNEMLHQNLHRHQKVLHNCNKNKKKPKLRLIYEESTRSYTTKEGQIQTTTANLPGIHAHTDNLKVE